MLLSQPVLCEDADEVEHGDGRIDTDEEVTHLPQDDGQVEVSEYRAFGVAVEEPKGNWDDEAEEVRDCDPLIFGTDGVFVFGYAPRNGQGVELLDELPAPNVGALEPLQDWFLILDDRNHHNPIQEGPDDTSHDLDEESVSWRQMDVLRQFDIPREKLGLLHRIVSEACKVHVR